MEVPHIYGSVVDHNNGIDVARNLTDADAALIVRAVNAHDALISALRALVLAWHDVDAPGGWDEGMDAALKQAGALLRQLDVAV
jgi:hypothetical protein